MEFGNYLLVSGFQCLDHIITVIMFNPLFYDINLCCLLPLVHMFQLIDFVIQRIVKNASMQNRGRMRFSAYNWEQECTQFQLHYEGFVDCVT